MAPRWPVRVLLADRPNESRAAMHQALALSGWEVTAADCADDALALVRRQRIACLLLETDLPGLPTDELLRRVLEEEPSLAVVIAPLAFPSSPQFSTRAKRPRHHQPASPRSR
jgi:DNA-binding NtrC family response regulator